jgi:hypothetical protein
MLLGSGCASRAIEVAPKPTDPAAYAAWDCERLFDDSDLVQRQAADVAYAVDARAGDNMLMMGLGVTVFWPALLAMRPEGPEAAELAALKGRFEAMRLVSDRRCGPPPEAMAARRQAALPVVLGTPHSLAMTVTALRREQIEFRVARDDLALSRPWRQDLAGNTVFEDRAPLIGWRRLLKPDLALGQVLSGELAAADDAVPAARVRGQVVAIGPQTVAGRSFDVAVIELFGEAPLGTAGQGQGMDGSARLDGVMAVDRRSGVLLRLELRCANSDYALRRRLVRVDPAGP